jgi:hypothetical protein
VDGAETRDNCNVLAAVANGTGRITPRLALLTGGALKESFNPLMTSPVTDLTAENVSVAWGTERTAVVACLTRTGILYGTDTVRVHALLWHRYCESSCSAMAQIL